MHREPSDLYKLSQRSLAASDRWFGDTPVVRSLPHLVLGMCGETGDVADIIKRLDRGSTTLAETKTQVDLVMELADVFIYFLNICAVLRVDPLVIYEQKMAENEKRFTKERINREEAREIVDGIPIRRHPA